MEEFIKITKLNPSISSANEGDYIIEDYCNKILYNLFENAFYTEVPTSIKLSSNCCRHIATSDVSFVLGTNLLASTKSTFKQWNINFIDLFKIKNGTLSKIKMLSPVNLIKNNRISDIVLMGVGWWQYQQKPSLYMQKLLKCVLSKNYIHSVRDEYTKEMLQSVGINNVVNTACPTMWNLTPEFCSGIPCQKSDTVVTTLTDYNKIEKYDKDLLDILKNNYRNVYVWFQSKGDYEYIKNLKEFNNIKIVNPGLRNYDLFLENNNVDYVGTRLHAGIRALNHKIRTIIVAVDNRAVEISKTTNLPIIKRDDIKSKLDQKINCCEETAIVLPQREIAEWKSQFRNT